MSQGLRPKEQMERKSKGGGGLTVGGKDDSNNETVDTDHTSHDYGNDVPHDEIGLHDTHSGHTDARLGGTVRSTEA